jgi:hypothetical protein
MIQLAKHDDSPIEVKVATIGTSVARMPADEPEAKVRLTARPPSRRVEDSPAREKARENTRRWRLANPERVKENNARWRKKNPGESAKRSLEWREKNPERHRALNRRWYLDNRDRWNENCRKRITKRRQTDSAFQITCSLRSRLSQAIKDNPKSARTMELIGCSIIQLRAHLESKFTFGMSWENYGGWHVDHIRPCVSFDLSNPAQQRECFHFTNLQPLWAIDNLKKGAKHQ